MKKGDLDAVIVVGGKPYVSVTTFNNDGRFHLAAVDYSKPLQSDYLPATLTSKDYPNLIPEGETVKRSQCRRCLQRTIGHPTLNAVASLLCSWTPSSRNRRFAEPALSSQVEGGLLTAPLAGWNRLPLAQQWLDKHGVEPVTTL